MTTKDQKSEISREAIEQIMRSNPAASAYKVGIGEVWVWIHGAMVSKRGQRRAILEAFLAAPNNRLTCGELARIACMYTPRILELRAACFPIPNLLAGDGSTYYQLMITDAQVREIRAALAVADVLKPARGKNKPRESVAVAQPVPPPANAAGQFSLGLAPSASSFLDRERGVTE